MDSASYFREKEKESTAVEGSFPITMRIEKKIP